MLSFSCRQAGLRLELAQAEDLPAALGDAHTRLQQTRAHALATVLGTHREGVPLALSQQVAAWTLALAPCVCGGVYRT